MILKIIILASKYYDIEYGLQDHFDPTNFIIVYPYAAQYSGDISTFNFVNDGLEIHSKWSHPLSTKQKHNILNLNIVTGDIRIMSETYQNNYMTITSYNSSIITRLYSIVFNSDIHLMKIHTVSSNLSCFFF